MKTYFINPNLRNFIYSQEKSSISKFTRLTDLLEEYDKRLGMPYSKHIQDNLYELRIRGQQEIRVFYCFQPDKIVFIHAFVKKSKKTPPQEIKTALFRIKLLTNT